ncbi:MAG: mevalonate kinase [Nanoarchaeota archaeon]|nr:mevalonate kinase [Nanoarchaeota archaeon]
MTHASACGKIIMFGEHAVVYGRQAIAVPIPSYRTDVKIEDSEEFNLTSNRELSDKEKDRLTQMCSVLYARFKLVGNILLEINSDIPINTGMGSSAALSVATARAVSDHFKLGLGIEEINAAAFECEKIFHGTPSGIDNSVVCYEKPIYFMETPQAFDIKEKFTLVIANSGIRPSTKEVLAEIRFAYIKDTEKYSKLFDEIAAIVSQARKCMETGDIKSLGNLMTLNHDYLRMLGVSIPETDRIVNLALDAGALGAKVSGAGKGGNVIVLVTDKTKDKVLEALSSYKTIISEIR